MNNFQKKLKTIQIPIIINKMRKVLILEILKEYYLIIQRIAQKIIQIIKMIIII